MSNIDKVDSPVRGESKRELQLAEKQVDEFSPKSLRRKTKVPTLLLTCVDFRMRTLVNSYMDAIGLKDKYDEIALPGASIGACGKQESKINFINHMNLLVRLHEVKTIIVIDHLDCGAYKNSVGEEEYIEDPVKHHCYYLRSLMKMINKVNPNLEVKLRLMNLKGEVFIVEEEK